MLRYTIYADSHLIYNPRIIGDNGEALYKVLEPTLTETTESFSSLTFSAMKGSPAYDYCTELAPRIKVYNGSSLYWTGRILNITPNIYDKREYYCEDILGVLLNTIVRPYEFDGTVADFFEYLVTCHNSQSNNSEQFGYSCDINDSISRSSESYDSTWNVIKGKLLDNIGGYIWVDYDANEDPVIHYSKNARNANLTPIQLGTNLSEFSVRNKFDQFYTACVPLGAKDESTNEYLTIADVNGGNDYLIDAAAAATYGIIYAPVSETTWENVTVANNLLTRAQTWLQNEASRGLQEITISAVDASVYDINLDPYMWLDSVEVIATGFDETMILKSVTRRLDDPASVSISMGMERSTVTGTQVSKTAEALNRIQTIESNYTTGEQVAAITEATLEESTLIEQRANAIIATALADYVLTSDYNTFKSSILTNFSVLAGEVEAGFTSTASSISTLDTETKNSFASIYSFIRLLATLTDSGGNITQQGGIVIGESSSDIKLKLENDILYFFTGDEKLVTTDNAIAWFASNQLYVNNASIHNLTLGTSGEYLDARIVGTGDNVCVLWSGRIS